MSKLFSRFNFQFTFIKIYIYIFIDWFFFIIMKILTDFRKTVETGMDPRMDLPLALFEQRGSVVP